jgi:hypothetical protein
MISIHHQLLVLEKPDQLKNMGGIYCKQIAKFMHGFGEENVNDNNGKSSHRYKYNI